MQQAQLDLSPSAQHDMAAKLLVVLCVTMASVMGGLYDGLGGGLALGGLGHGGGLALGGLGHGGGLALGGGYALGGGHAVVAPVAKQVIDHYDPNPAYKFEYAVHDAHTGDAKSQTEERHGDVVHGSYSLVEPDGSKRIVEYTADPHNGFNAIVHREHNAHPQVVQKVVAAPVIKAAPILSHY